MLDKKRILLVITGGIAAYKCLELIRRLRDRDAEVQCVMSAAARQFVTPLSVQSLSEKPVLDNLFDLTKESEIGHVKLSRLADLVVIAPASADFLAKIANGHASDLPSTVLAANDKPALIAPAMNPAMWQNPATQRNVEKLRQNGFHFVGPEIGEMAESDEAGIGRFSEPAKIIKAMEDIISNGPLSGEHIIITAGPTYEPIDPVRYIANRSSGKQGYAIAHACVAAGAKVTLISGPTHLPRPQAMSFVPVETAQQMHDAVFEALPADIAIMNAAVADWRVPHTQEQKIKKDEAGSLRPLEIEQTPDILKILCDNESRPALVIGFAAETENMVDHAKSKRMHKGADWIVANNVSASTKGGVDVMGGDKNSVYIIREDTTESWPVMTKINVANRLVEAIIAVRDRAC